MLAVASYCPCDLILAWTHASMRHFKPSLRISAKRRLERCEVAVSWFRRSLRGTHRRLFDLRAQSALAELLGVSTLGSPGCPTHGSETFEITHLARPHASDRRVLGSRSRLAAESSLWRLPFAYRMSRRGYPMRRVRLPRYAGAVSLMGVSSSPRPTYDVPRNPTVPAPLARGEQLASS